MTPGDPYTPSPPPRAPAGASNSAHCWRGAPGGPMLDAGANGRQSKRQGETPAQLKSHSTFRHAHICTSTSHAHAHAHVWCPASHRCKLLVVKAGV